MEMIQKEISTVHNDIKEFTSPQDLFEGTDLDDIEMEGKIAAALDDCDALFVFENWDEQDFLQKVILNHFTDNKTRETRRKLFSIEETRQKLIDGKSN